MLYTSHIDPEMTFVIDLFGNAKKTEKTTEKSEKLQTKCVCVCIQGI